MGRRPGTVPGRHSTAARREGGTVEVMGNDYLDLELAADATTSASTTFGVLNKLKVDLFKADIVPARDTPLGTYQAAVADYDGYGSATVTWNGPSRSDTGKIEVVGTVPEFRPTGTTTPNTVFGFFTTTFGDNSLGYAGRFDDAPIPMEDALDAIVLTLRYQPHAEAAGVVVS